MKHQLDLFEKLLAQLNCKPDKKHDIPQWQSSCRCGISRLQPESSVEKKEKKAKSIVEKAETNQYYDLTLHTGMKLTDAFEVNSTASNTIAYNSTR